MAGWIPVRIGINKLFYNRNVKYSQQINIRKVVMRLFVVNTYK